jgi:hypothetical protein
VSKHWNPQDDVARIERLHSRKTWPAGATAGLLVVAAACLGVGVVLYKVAGPREVVAERGE